MRQTAVVFTVALGAFCAASLRGDSPVQSDDREEFEAAVVRRAPPGSVPWSRLEIDPGRLEAKSTSLRYLIMEANQIGDFQISGTSGWMESELYTVSATAGKAVERRQLMAMLRGLLAEQFQLKFHRETRRIPVFALVVDKGGFKLKPLREGETPAQPAHSDDQLAMLAGRTIPDLVRNLNSRTGAFSPGRPVIDRTGIEGTYGIWLIHEVENDPEGRSGRMIIDYPSALIRQLGLRLEPVVAPVDFFVIDSAARPALDQ